MKQISLPITLLGRIAPLASKPSREELLKEVSTPITISDLMEKENKNNAPLNEAPISVEDLEKLSENLHDFLDKNTPQILSLWSSQVGFDKAVSFSKMLSESESIELVDRLIFCFTAAGYMLAKSEEKE